MNHEPEMEASPASSVRSCACESGTRTVSRKKAQREREPGNMAWICTLEGEKNDKWRQYDLCRV